MSGIVRTREFELISQSLTSSVRILRTRAIFPSGEKATDQTPLEWPVSVARSAFAARSQIFTVVSPLPDASDCPSGEKATAKT